MFNRIILIMFFMVLICSTASAEHYQVYGRVSPYVDTTNSNTRYWAAVLKIRNLTTGSLLTCFPADKSTWSQIWAGDYSLIDLTRTDGQDDCYIDYPLDDAGYKSALLQMLNHTHKIGRYLQDQGHQIQIQFYEFSPIDYLQRANDTPTGVRITTPAFTAARQNKLNENIDILDCAVTQIQGLQQPTQVFPSDDYGELPTYLSWNPVENATSYTLQTADNPDFSNPTIYDNLQNTSQSVSGFTYLKRYYWRVLAKGNYGMSLWSSTRSFIDKYNFRYFRIRATGTSWYSNSMGTFELYFYTEPNQTGTQFATGATATASSTSTNASPAYAVDNNTLTYHNVSSTDTNRWLALDVTNAYRIKSLRLQTSYNTSMKKLMYASQFVLEASFSSDFSSVFLLGTFTTENINQTIWNYNVSY